MEAAGGMVSTAVGSGAACGVQALNNSIMHAATKSPGVILEIGNFERRFIF